MTMTSPKYQEKIFICPSLLMDDLIGFGVVVLP
jgi:hypothetical protein